MSGIETVDMRPQRLDQGRFRVNRGASFTLGPPCLRFLLYQLSVFQEHNTLPTESAAPAYMT
jgi:hypothetical protein